MSASVAAWRASAVRKGVMGLESDNDWFSPSWSVHVIEFLAYFACAARRPSHRLHLLLALSKQGAFIEVRYDFLLCFCEPPSPSTHIGRRHDELFGCTSRTVDAGKAIEYWLIVMSRDILLESLLPGVLMDCVGDKDWRQGYSTKMASRDLRGKILQDISLGDRGLMLIGYKFSCKDIRRSRSRWYTMASSLS
jgi:hypothetical protein